MGFNLPFTQILQLATPTTTTITESSPCFYGWYDTRGCSSLSVQRTLFQVQSLYVLALWSCLILFCFFNSGFLTAVLPYRTASQSLLLAVDVDIFFSPTLVQLFSDVWSSQSFVTQAGDFDKIALCSCCYFWSTSQTFGHVLFYFLMSPNSMIYCSFGNFDFFPRFLYLNIFLFSNQFFKRYRVILKSKLLRKTCI